MKIIGLFKNKTALLSREDVKDAKLINDLLNTCMKENIKYVVVVTTLTYSELPGKLKEFMEKYTDHELLYSYKCEMKF
jgi:ribosomal protein L7Ae-like RNA K-turn-binding protein